MHVHRTELTPLYNIIPNDIFNTAVINLILSIISVVTKYVSSPSNDGIFWINLKNFKCVAGATVRRGLSVSEAGQLWPQRLGIRSQLRPQLSESVLCCHLTNSWLQLRLLDTKLFGE